MQQSWPLTKMRNGRIAPAFVAIGFALLFTVSLVGGNPENFRPVRLNTAALTFATQLIKEGHFIADGKGAWGAHRPSADEENEFIRLKGFAEYARWHFGIDDRYPENTKRRYKFPYGDFTNVHRCGLLAAKARARQYGYTEIESAAAELEREIRNQPRINTNSHRFRDYLCRICVNLWR